MVKKTDDIIDDLDDLDLDDMDIDENSSEELSDEIDLNDAEEEELILDDETDIKSDETDIKSEDTDVDVDGIDLDDVDVVVADENKEELDSVKTKLETDIDIDLDEDEFDLSDFEEEIEETTAEVKPIVETVEDTTETAIVDDELILDDTDIDTDNETLKSTVETETIQDEITEVLEEPKPEVKPVKKKPAKITKAKPKYRKKLKKQPVIYNPSFLISKITDDRYQIRRTKRTESDLKLLTDKIKLQGQIEPVQILKVGKEYYPLAGFGRIEVQTILESETVKAIIHEGLSETEIMQICTGSNEGRVELTEWDKIISVGMYQQNNADVSIDDIDEPDSLVCVFAFGRSTLRKYLQLYRFYKDRDDFKELYRENKCPMYVYSTVMEVIKNLKDYEIDDGTICNGVKDILRLEEMNKHRFLNAFTNFMTEYALSVKTGKSNVDSLDELDAEIDNDETTETDNEVKEDFDKLPTTIKAELEIEVDNHIKSMLKMLDSVKAEFKVLQDVKSYKKFVDNKKRKKLINKIGKLNEIVTQVL